MAIIIGNNGTCTLNARADADKATTMFGPAAASGSPAMIHDGFVRRWMLATHRRMVETTPMNSDVQTFHPGEGGAVVAVRGWIDSTLAAVTTDVGRYNVALGTYDVELLLSENQGQTKSRQYKMRGWMENMNVENPVDLPQQFSGIVRVTGDIDITWEAF